MASAPRKRKRGPEQPTMALSASLDHIPGPVLAVYPAVQPSTSVPFKPYTLKNSRPDKSDGTDDIIIAGETDEVEFVTNQEESRRAAESGCRYIIALHNKRTGAISLLPSSKSPQVLQRTVKALKSIQAVGVPSTPSHREARTALGETFGTKKAKAAIRAQERNKIDVNAMEDVMDYVMEGIDKGAEGLMTTEEAKEITDNNRLIPPFSTTATEPDNVYPFHGIIPENEWKALSITPFDGTSNDEERIALLPHSRSKWINRHMRIWSKPDSGKNRKKNLKILLYLSGLLAFRHIVEKRGFNADQARERLSALPGIVVDGLFSRFTEKARGSASNQPTSATRALILTNIFALCLKLDNFATNTEVLSHDLSLSKDQVNQFFRSLGCKISKLGERERTRLGISDSGETKFAVLNAPVVFPNPRQKRRN